MKSLFPVLLLVSSPLAANDFAVAFETGGHGLVGVNVEWVLNERRRLTGGHAATWDLVGFVTPGEVSVMQMSWLNHTWLHGSSAHWFEVSLGPEYVFLEQTEWFGDDIRRSHAWLVNSNLGYRYERLDGVMQFRAGLTLHAEIGDANNDGESATAAIGYLSFGVRF